MFNLFKKNKNKSQAKTSEPKTILCIPGNWEDRNELLIQIADNTSKEYLFMGFLLMNIATEECFEIEFCDRDIKMKEAFRYAGMVNRITEDFLNEIDKHKSVVFISYSTGDLAKAKAIAEAGLAILKSGGIGIKLETTGKAFTKENWAKLLMGYKESNLYEMFVLDSISNGENITYTCGMHNLGLKDCIVYNEEFQYAVNLLSIFGYYQLIDKPKIKINETFSTAADSPYYRIKEEIKQPYTKDELFWNPYGMWKLERL